MKNPMKALLEAVRNRRQRREQAQLKSMRMERDQARREVQRLNDRLLSEMDDNSRLREAYQAIVEREWARLGVGRYTPEEIAAGIDR